MKLWERFAKRRAIRSYVQVLPRLLKKRYGRHKKYTREQVQKTVAQAGLNREYIYYAIAMYATRKEFETLQKDAANPLDYGEARKEIADSHFDGNEGFTIQDALDASAASSGFFGGGTECDAGESGNGNLGGE